MNIKQKMSMIILLLFFLVSCLNRYEVTKREEIEQKIIEKKINRELCMMLLCADTQAYNFYDDETGGHKEVEVLPGYESPKAFYGVVAKNNEECGLVYRSIDKSNILIAFKGSKSVQDWIEDFEFWQVKDYQDKYVKVNDLYVDGGFYNVFEACNDNLMTILENIDPDHKAVLYITGHSLGGPVAVLFTLNIIYNKIYPAGNVYLYTFAGPRAGNPVFVSTFNKNVKNVFRIVNYHDLVPCLPPEEIFGYNYKHVKGQYLICFLPASGKKIIANCHVSDNYYEALENQFKLDIPCDQNQAPVDLTYCTPPFKEYKADYKRLMTEHKEVYDLLKDKVTE